MDNRYWEFNIIARQPCYATSNAYETGVRIAGGGTPTTGAYYYDLDW